MFVVELYAFHAVLLIESISQDLFKEGVNFTSTIDFTKSRTRTNDTTIRFESLGS